jgi:dihydrofolate synthase/folylpolyglutamate synthase
MQRSQKQSNPSKMTDITSDAILDRMMALHPKVIDLTLDRVWRLLAALDNPQNKLPPVIHIAGTNGKGSTQAMILAGLKAAGKTAHAYTSPHLARFHERIRLAGDLIAETHLTEILDECYAKNNHENITYFEITTCAALLAMARTPADYTLLEVGLGGRLDATNVVDRPAVTIITPVSMDHEGFLGDTLAKIASEKAGIIKRGVPVIVGPQQPEAMDVIEATAARLGAPILTYGQHWHVAREGDRLVYQDETGLVDVPLPNLPGAHQYENAGAAIAALRYLGFDDTAFDGAATSAFWPARMQKLARGPVIDAAPNCEIWLDGGHNPAAGQAIADHLKTLPARPTYMVCGMLNTKDIQGYLRPMADSAKHLFAVSIPGEANTLPAAQTAQAAIDCGLDATSADTVLDAVTQINATDPNARILICGSLYLAGNILKTHE